MNDIVAPGGIVFSIFGQKILSGLALQPDPMILDLIFSHTY